MLNCEADLLGHEEVLDSSGAPVSEYDDDVSNIENEIYIKSSPGTSQQRFTNKIVTQKTSRQSSIENIERPKKRTAKLVHIKTIEGEFNVTISGTDDEDSDTEQNVHFIYDNKLQLQEDCIPSLDLSDPKQLTDFARVGPKLQVNQKLQSIKTNSIGIG